MRCDRVQIIQSSLVFRIVFLVVSLILNFRRLKMSISARGVEVLCASMALLGLVYCGRRKALRFCEGAVSEPTGPEDDQENE
jgi:hypothetical protein